MHGYVSINGVIEAADKARVSVFDRIYLHGDGVVEVLAGYDGRALACTAHVARLYRSAALIRLSLPWTQQELQEELQAMAARIPSGRSYLRLAVAAGLGLGMVRAGAVQKTIFCLPLPPLTTGDSCALQTVTRNKHELLAAKTPGYLGSVVAVAAAREAGYDDVLWLDQSGQVAEASTANIFFVTSHGDQLSCCTPSPESGLLEGITAQYVTTALAAHGIETVSRVVHSSELGNFTAALLTSSVRGVRPVQRIDARTYVVDSPAVQRILVLLAEQLPFTAVHAATAIYE